jgi:hypothetical protein
MEVFKIKISPEVLRNELTTQSYSGLSFGYYSGLSYVLSSGTVNLGTWQQGNPFSIGYLASTLIPISFDSNILNISKTGRTNYDWTQYLADVNTGSTITINYQNSIFELITTGPPIEDNFYVSFPISAITIPFELPIFDEAGWLKLGFSNYQPSMANNYSNSGSIYFCGLVFIPLGLPPSQPFWTDPDMDWSQKKCWNGETISIDGCLKPD